MIPDPPLLITSFFLFLKLIVFIERSLENSQNFFMQSLPLYTSCLFSMLLNEDILEIEKPDGTFSLTFVVDKLWMNQSFFIHSRSA